MKVDVSATGPFTLGTPRVVFDFSRIGSVNLSGWDVAPDGLRFLLVRAAPNAPRQAAAITIIQNRFAEFSNRDGTP